MLISKKCLNCGHVATQEANVQACPSCSAFYNKVESTFTLPGDLPQPNVAPIKKPVQRARQQPPGKFIDVLRAESNYPNFRVLVKLATWFFYLIAIALAVSALFMGDAIGSVRIWFILGAVVMAVIVTATKEAVLMLADLSDAAVNIAGTNAANAP